MKTTIDKSATLGERQLILTLWVVAIASLFAFPLLMSAANRLVNGKAVAASTFISLHDLWWIMAFMSIAPLCFIPRSIVRNVLIYISVLVTLAGICVAIINGSISQNSAGTMVRTAPGAAFWLSGTLLLLTGNESLRLIRLSATGRLSMLAGMLTIPALLLLNGRFNSFSLLKEYASHRDAFIEALYVHLALSLATIVIAFIVGVPLGVLILRHPLLRRLTFAALNFIQTVPSLALMGLLIAPLAWLGYRLPWLHELGITGIGTPPALIALVLYALLPQVRNTVTSIEQIPADTLEAAEGTGMDRHQRFWSVTWPLALPIILSGTRVVAIQTPGMVMVAALIGAGGMGTIMFQGLSGSSLDLTLLGVLPTVTMTLIFDAFFRLVTDKFKEGKP